MLGIGSDGPRGGSFRGWIPAVLAGLALLAGATIWISLSATALHDSPDPTGPTTEQTFSQRLEAACELGKLSTLRWPDWSGLRSPVTDFYRARDLRPAWISDGRPTEQALAIVSLLEGAATSGLRAEDYDGLRWPGRILRLHRSAGIVQAFDFDLALTVNLMRFARDLHGGRVDPRRLGLPLDWPPKSIDLAKLVEELVSAPDPTARLERLEPPLAGYRRLKLALVNYLELARERDFIELPAVEVVRPGDRYSGLAALAGLLARLGDLAPRDLPAPTAERYEGAMVEAVRSFQRRHGLASDGRINALTLAQLRTPLSHRALQIELALERFRWVPIIADQQPIVVNLPEFVLRAYDERGEIAFSTKVVVGRAFRTETPVFADRLRAVVFRPSWSVPLSIARDELVPLIERDPDYLARENLEIVGASSQEPTPETLAELRRGTLQLRQRPGLDNSLGLIKFDFPNEHNVYMHGTPATAAFARARRDLSHGCIRLEDPAGLAAWVLRGTGSWSPEEIRAAIEGDADDQAVVVSPEIPVYLVYVTAVVPENEQPRFFADLYGHDARLEQALAESYPALRDE